MRSVPSVSVEVEGRGLLAAALTALALLAIVASLLAELGATARIILAALVAAVLTAALLSLRRRPRRLRLAADGTAWLDDSIPARLIAARRYGPFLVLALAASGRRIDLVLLRPLLDRAIARRLIALAGAA